MLSEISQHLRTKLKVFSLIDNLILNNKIIPINQENFQELLPSDQNKTIAYIDGGQAELISGGNLCLNLIRVSAQILQGTKRISSQKQEFYLLTTAVYKQGDIWYESKIFGDSLVNEEDLLICSNDSSLKSGQERGPIGKVANMARRFAELKLASEAKADYVLLDGTLEPTFKNEEKYLSPKVSALAKTCSLFTTCGNNPAILLQRLSPNQGSWHYFVVEKTYFVKLHPRAKHLFRFEGSPEILSHLIESSSDPIFLGYPYGLILADKMARVSNNEKNSLKMNLLLRDENKEIASYLNSMNAHEILDSLS